MLRSARGLIGFRIEATDGDVGTVDGLYFDDDQWIVRYFVVDTRAWLGGHHVLISPASVRGPEWAGRRLPVAITRADVEGGPGIEAHRPISREYEIVFSEYYGVPFYWGTPYTGIAISARVGGADRADPHLHSTEEFQGYAVRGTDADVGRVDDLLIEELTWRIRYLDVDTGHWWPGKHVLVAPAWLENVSWGEATVSVALPRDTIKTAPPYDPGRPLDRSDEQRLYAFYGLPGYWEERAAA